RHRDGARAPHPREDRSERERATSPDDRVGSGLPVGPMKTADAAELAAIAAAVTLIGAAFGAVVLRLLRRRSIAAQVVALTCILVFAVLAGPYVASRKMFISSHDLTALLIVLTAAGVVAVGIALVLGARIGNASRSLVVAASHLGRDGADAAALTK